MAVPAVNLTIDKGTDFSSTFTITNPDGTAYNLLNSSAVAKLKKFPDSETSYSFSTSVVVSTGVVGARGDKVGGLTYASSAHIFSTPKVNHILDLLN